MRMRADTQSLPALVQSRLKELADPARARAMAAYMKTDQPFYGVPTPDRAPIVKELKTRFVPDNRTAYERAVLSLWKLPHREERYVAIAYARSQPRFVTIESIPLYERMIREGAWWDFVDEIAVHLAGAVLLANRAEMGPIVERWIGDADMWIRRSALIAQTRHKAATDREVLFDHCLRRAAEKDFFIRKAIGWALREYGKTNPAAVRSFLKRYRARLSPLSFKEGSKHLGPAV
ncbi:MAG TPA: DNA alkylation repair protein [Candidatus Binataceae bacterium]|nr:DNA alkylation repair protein [Candidatus Binataceae bacterium]